MDGWPEMLLDDQFYIGKVLPNWPPFPTGLVLLGFSQKKMCIIADIMYLHRNIKGFTSLGTQKQMDGWGRT